MLMDWWLIPEKKIIYRLRMCIGRLSQWKVKQISAMILDLIGFGNKYFTCTTQNVPKKYTSNSQPTGE